MCRYSAWTTNDFLCIILENSGSSQVWPPSGRLLHSRVKVGKDAGYVLLHTAACEKHSNPRSLMTLSYVHAADRRSNSGNHQSREQTADGESTQVDRDWGSQHWSHRRLTVRTVLSVCVEAGENTSRTWLKVHTETFTNVAVWTHRLRYLLA